MTVKQYLNDHILLFDGAMGTYYSTCYPDDGSKCEQANILHPERVLRIHKEYLEAGAKAIKTNTFGANTQALDAGQDEVCKVIEAGWRLANEAVKDADAFVFADIGPLVEQTDEYYHIVDRFLELGAQNFLFETFADDAGLAALAAYIKARCPVSFVVTSFAAAPDGFTRRGLEVHALLRRAMDCTEIDAVGLNCMLGPNHMLRLAQDLPAREARHAFMPNAGYPTIVRGHTIFDGNASYFADRCGELAAIGAKILGGCCGTTPRYIELAAQILAKKSYPHAPKPVLMPANQKLTHNNRLAEKLRAGKRLVAVELDPPADSNIDAFMAGARRLKAAGVDAVTIADCPVARVRVDSSLLAAKLRRELDLDPIPHMTCRDRNINATKALLLGLSAEEVRNILVVTGDPIPTAERDEVKGVFSFHSVVLAGYIRELGEQGITQPFQVCGALNVNARNFDAELEKAVRKQQAGVQVFLTQPVFTEQAFANLQRAHKRLDAAILGGLIPIVSHRNALFMSHEISGIDIPDEMVARYEGLDRVQAEQVAVSLTVSLARRMIPFTDGWYLITPFQRVSLIEQILGQIIHV